MNGDRQKSLIVSKKTAGPKLEHYRTLEQPSSASAKRTASNVESRMVQPMLRVQVQSMGTRLWWTGF
jgi:hypothetical protein